MELEQAIQQASNNDPLAFEELYKQYYSLVYRSIRSLVSDEDEVMDLLQDTFLKVYQKIGQFKGDSSSFPAWIKRIAINTAKDYLIKKNRSFSQKWKRIRKKTRRLLKKDLYWNPQMGFLT